MGKEHEVCETPSECSTVLNHGTPQLVSQENELESHLLSSTKLLEETSDSDVSSSGGATHSVPVTFSDLPTSPL